MAQQGLGTVGSMVGSYFAGPIGGFIGGQLGQAAGRYIDNSLKDPVPGARIGEQRISTATVGLPIARGWGEQRLPANMIWTNGIRRHSGVSKGKGAAAVGSKGQAVEDVRYTGSFAWAFAKGPATAILKLWADGKPVYDLTGTEIMAPDTSPIFPFRFYAGSETQMPDPLIAAEEGAERTPAHRGLCYIVCEDLDLTLYGNRVPNVVALIAFSGTKQITGTVLEDLPEDEGGVPSDTNPVEQTASAPVAYDGVRGLSYRIWPAEDAFGDAPYITVNSLLPMEAARAVSLEDVHADTTFVYEAPAPYDHPVIGTAGACDGSALYVLEGVAGNWKIVALDPISMKAVDEWGEYGAGGFGTSTTPETIGSNVWKLCVGQLRSATAVQDVIVATGQHWGPIVWLGLPTGLASGTITYLAGASDNADGTAWNLAHTGGAFTRASVIEGKRGEGVTEFYAFSWDSPSGASFDLWRMSVTAGLVTREQVGVFAAADFDGGWSALYMRGAEYDRANDQVIFHLAGTSLGDGRVAAIDRAGEIAWNTALGTQGVVADTYAMGNSRLLLTRYSFVTSGSEVITLDTRTGEVLDTQPKPTNSVTAGSADLDIGSSYQAFDSVTGLAWMASTQQFQRILTGTAASEAADLADIVSDICADCGLTADDIDVTDLVGTSVIGYQTNLETGIDPITELSRIYFFDYAEQDDKLTFRLRASGTPAAEVPYSDLLRKGEEPAIKPQRDDAFAVPTRFVLRYPDASKQYQQGTQTFSRTTAPSPVAVVAGVHEETGDTAVYLTPDEAATWCKRRALERWRQRTTYQDVGLPSKWLRLVPNDVVTLGIESGLETYKVRVTQIDIGADYSLKANFVTEDATLLTTTTVGDSGDGYVAPGLPKPYAVVPLLMALPLLRDADDTAGSALRVYTAASTYPGQTFGGAQILVSPSAGADFDQFGSTITSAASWGNAINALAAPADPWITDNVNTIDVYMAQGGDDLTTATSEQVLNGANAAALATTTGGVEVLQFTIVTPLGGGRYRLFGLLRGRRGTEWACGLHGPGDRFVLLTPDDLRTTAASTSALAAPRYVKAVGFYDIFDLAPAYPITFNGTAEKPYAPAHVEGERDGSNNLTITWVRRSRYGGEWTDGTEVVPIGEEDEEYEVDVMDGDTVVRTIAGLTAETATYTAAAQTTDFGSPQAEVTVRVYQISALVDRGYPAEATV